MLESKVIKYTDAKDLSQQVNDFWKSFSTPISYVDTTVLADHQVMLTIKKAPQSSETDFNEALQRSTTPQPQNNLASAKQIKYIRHLQSMAGIKVDDEETLHNLTKKKAGQIIHALKQAEKDTKNGIKDNPLHRDKKNLEETGEIPLVVDIDDLTF